MQNEENNKVEAKTNPKIYVGAVLGGIVVTTLVALLRGKQDSVITFYQSTGLLLLSLSLLVVIHEWGHYITARMFGMRVEKFYLFFDAWDVKLWSFTKNGTEYGIGWLPLGGYVKIAGMVDENMDTSFLESAPQPWEFRSKPAWQRLIVMTGGVIMNVILGIFILSLATYYYGEDKTPMASVKYGIQVTNPRQEKAKDGTAKTVYPIAYLLGFRNGDELLSFKGESKPFLEDYAKINLLIEDGGYFDINRKGQKMKINIPLDAMNMLQSDSTDATKGLFDVNMLAKIQPVKTRDGKYVSMALKAGLQAGDKITKLDTTPIASYTDIMNFTAHAKPYDSVYISYERAGNSLTVALKLDSLGKMGIMPDSQMLASLIMPVEYGLFESFIPGTRKAFSIVSINIAAIGKLFKGQLNPRKSMMGPVGMGQTMGNAFSLGGWRSFIFLTGAISMMLAFSNIIPLPLPVLDGGHVMFLLYEWIRGKAAPMKVFFIAQNIGLFLVLGLMLFSFGNDLLRIFSK